MNLSLTFENIAEKYAFRIWYNKDLSAIDDLLAKDIVIHGLLGDHQGQKAMKTIVEAWLSAFPDLKVTNKKITSEHPVVIIEWEAKGTHLGEFKTIKPTGRKVFYEGLTIYTIKDNKITNYEAQLDMQHLLNQII